MYNTSEFRKGLKVEIDGNPYVITDNQFVKPGKGTAFNRVKFKNMITGATLDRTIRSGENVQKANVEEENMVFLYEATGDYHFMNQRNFEQVTIGFDGLGESKNYLTENLEVKVLFWNGRAITVDVPNFIEAQITKCDPGVKGDTVSGATKPATLSTGYTVAVPLFVNEGEWIRVDTRTGEYMDRVKK